MKLSVPVKLYVGFIIAIGSTLIVISVLKSSIYTDRAVLVAAIYFLVLGIIAESLPIRIKVDNSISISSMVSIAALLLFDVHLAVIIRFLGAILAVRKNQTHYTHLFNLPIYRSLFNGSARGLVVFLAGRTYLALSALIPEPTFLGFNLMGLSGLVLVYFALDLALYSSLFSLLSKRRLLDEIATKLWTTIYLILLAPAGVFMAGLYAWGGIFPLILFFGPFLFVRHAFELNIKARQTSDEINVLYTALTKIAGAQGNIKTISKCIAEIVVKDFHAYECAVLFLSDDRLWITRKAYCGPLDSDDEISASSDMVGLITAAMHMKESIYVPDVRKEPRYFMGMQETRSEFVVPLLSRGEVLGVINMESPNLDDFNERTRRLVLAFTENAAVVIQNAKLVTSLENINHELEQRVEERTAELQAVNKELETFSFAVSHDLRAPLRAIRRFSEIVVNDFGDRLDPMAKGFLDKVIQGATEMSDKIDGLLRFSRLSHSELHWETLDLSALAIEALATLRAGDPERAVTWEVRPQITARGDLVLISNVLENLLGNAWKYSAKNPQAHIAFGMEERDGRPVYFVRDNGAGFDMQYASKLFGTFQRLHRAEEFEGHGIGLATVQRIIHRHGGRIWAEAEEGRGATFYFTLGQPK